MEIDNIIRWNGKHEYNKKALISMRLILYRITCTTGYSRRSLAPRGSRVISAFHASLFPLWHFAVAVCCFVALQVPLAPNEMMTLVTISLSNVIFGSFFLEPRLILLVPEVHPHIPGASPLGSSQYPCSHVLSLSFRSTALWN
jgi:hypothetical protein